MSYLQAAFEALCKEAKGPEIWYVVLTESNQAYGGPEEGGWWYTRSETVAFQEFATEELAQAACDKVRELAEELQADARRQHGESMLASMEWLEARGLEADYLPEPDGAEEYHVSVCQSLPEPQGRTRPHYE